jgi:transposase
VRGGGAFHHVAEWIERTDSLPVGSLSSQRISELLAAITPSDRDNFYRLWCAARSEEEYLALDITSVSSYSELIEDVEWGYNRDHEQLAQINLMMLMGETSRLPIYQTVYSGSIRDVSTLDTNMAAFDALTGGRPVMSVTDKGFYSLKNMRALLDSENKRFIAAVPFTSSFAKRQVDGERKDIDQAQNTIVIGGQSMRAVSKVRALDASHKVYTHIFYSAKKALGYREDLLGDVAVLKDEALSDPKKYSTSDAHTRYLTIRKSSSEPLGWTVSIKQDAIKKALGYTGWLVLISNCVSDPKIAIEVYRAKDIVEKGFMYLKDDLDLGRLRVHSQERMQNKVFIGFIALIVLSHIHAVMADNNLYRGLTASQLIKALSKQRVQVIDGTRIVFPATKQQRTIYAAFGVTPLA